MERSFPLLLEDDILFILGYIIANEAIIHFKNLCQLSNL